MHVICHVTITIIYMHVWMVLKWLAFPEYLGRHLTRLDGHVMVDGWHFPHPHCPLPGTGNGPDRIQDVYVCMCMLGTSTPPLFLVILFSITYYNGLGLTVTCCCFSGVTHPSPSTLLP